MTELSLRAHPRVEPVRTPLIELAGVEKVYRTGKVAYRALRGVGRDETALEHLGLEGLGAEHEHGGALRQAFGEHGRASLRGGAHLVDARGEPELDEVISHRLR